MYSVIVLNNKTKDVLENKPSSVCFTKSKIQRGKKRCLVKTRRICNESK